MAAGSAFAGLQSLGATGTFVTGMWGGGAAVAAGATAAAKAGSPNDDEQETSKEEETEESEPEIVTYTCPHCHATVTTSGASTASKRSQQKRTFQEKNRILGVYSM